MSTQLKLHFMDEEYKFINENQKNNKKILY